MKLPASGALARNVTVAGQSIKLIQHFMDTPVVQPRRKGGPKADLTGLKVWPVSLRLVEYMHAHLLSGVQQRAGERPLRVLELGAGCGSLGIGLAALGLQVVLTDPGLPVKYSEAEEGNTLGWLRANVDANRELLGDRASVARLLWGEAAHMEAVQAQRRPLRPRPVPGAAAHARRLHDGADRRGARLHAPAPGRGALPPERTARLSGGDDARHARGRGRQ